MSDSKDTPTIINRAVRNGREFVTRADGTSWTRKLDRATNQPITDWTPVEPPPTNDTTTTTTATAATAATAAAATASPAPNTVTRCYLSVVASHQASNDLKHWALFSHAVPPNSPTDTAPGQVWQVTGDAEFMRHDHSEGLVDLLNSPDFAWHQVLRDDLSEEEFKRVDEIAREEKPPRAMNRAAVREHCQGWVVRVVKRLVGEGIVKGKVVGGLERVMDPIVN